jgi:hypothetical protein
MVTPDCLDDLALGLCDGDFLASEENDSRSHA